MQLNRLTVISSTIPPLFYSFPFFMAKSIQQFENSNLQKRILRLNKKFVNWIHLFQIELNRMSFWVNILCDNNFYVL